MARRTSRPPKPPRTFMHHTVFVFFFLSGFSSLVFEVIWERLLMQVFGSTTFAISTLLTAFMAGLAIGSLIGGRVAARLERPLRVYGLLEGSIGLYALVVPFLLELLPDVYRLIFDTFIDDFVLFSLLRFAAVFVILLLPTTLMGATLPIVSQWISQHERVFQGSIGLLYGTNTFGACAGSFLAGFVLLPALGLSTTNLVFAVVNFALCALVLVVEATVLRDLKTPDEHDVEGAEADVDEDLAALGLADTRRTLADPVLGWVRIAVLGAFAVAGGVSMSYQVLWTRAYVIVLGSSTYSFTTILVSFLIGLASGSAVMSSQLGKIRRPVFWLAVTQLGVCASGAMTFFFIDHLPELMFERLRDTIGSANEIYAFNFGLVGALVLLPTFLQGMALPLVVRALIDDRADSGRSIGRLYALNTVGAITGSFLAGFVLLPTLGLGRAIGLVIALNLAIGLVLAAAELGAGERRSARLGALGAAVVLACVALVAAPQIDRVKLTRGMFRVYWARELFDRKKLERDAPELVFYADGVTATISVEQRGKLVTLKANGKAEASDGADMSTQILVGLIPFVLQASAYPEHEIGSEVAAMVGYGSGVTAGAALQWPLKSLEVVEIEEEMVGASRFFDHVNHAPLDDERTQLVISDGRNYLEYTRGTFDVIVSEPSNPWIAGVASLFTVEHFRRAKRHLKPNGVFSQWVQLYEMDPENVRVILATFTEVFEHVMIFSSMPKGTDLILIGSDQPLMLPPEGLERAWAIDSVRTELERAGLKTPYDFYGLMFMNYVEALEFAEGAILNTDDNGYLEFEAPKDLVRYRSGQKFFAEKYHQQGTYGDARPHLGDWGDASAWTPERVAELAMSTWRAGKRPLADAVLEEAGIRLAEVPIAPPFGAVEQLALAQHAASIDLDEAVWRLWPYPGSPMHVTVIDAAKNGKQNQAMMYLEGEERPERDGYSGEKGLFYAYLLMRRRYMKHALRQLDRLAEEADPAVVGSVPFSMLQGAVYAKRMKYAKSLDAYIAAGEKLTVSPREGGGPAPRPSEARSPEREAPARTSPPRP